MSPAASTIQSSKAVPSRVQPLPGTITSQETRKASSPKPLPTPTKATADVHYTCFIRLPFSRNGFEDPPPVVWDATKDRALWKLISNNKTSSSKDIDWGATAERFDVGMPFLLQQAAWLFERHVDGMRKQMQKMAGISHVGTSTLTSSGGEPPESRPSSAVNTLKVVPAAAGTEGSSPGTPRSAGSLHPSISRSPSTTTVTQSRILTGSGSRQTLQRPFRGSSGSQRRPAALSRPSSEMFAHDDDEYALGHDGPSNSGSEDEPPSRSQAFKRAPLGKKSQALGTLSSDGDAEDDEESSSGGFLPFAAVSKVGTADDLAYIPTVPQSRRHGAPPPHSLQANNTRQTKAIQPSESSASSAASSAHHPPPSSSEEITASMRPPGPISPKHRAQLVNASLSPRSRSGREAGSEDSPSMGSSFSDLDDASVTQSALEDALLSNMQHGNFSSIGTIASRVGRIGDVLRKG